MTGRLKLDELVTRTYPLEGINEAFAAMKAGAVARSIVMFQASARCRPCLGDKKRPPGPLEVSGGTALAVCVNPRESVPAQVRTLPWARNQHNRCGARSGRPSLRIYT